MERLKNIFKSWKTTLFGLVILGGLAYKAFTVGFSISDSVVGLIAAGFIVAKDKNNAIK
tara:strand:- start:217 stop:393 length:177 start_codon:yes stop_codon:yes gene_type:complete